MAKKLFLVLGFILFLSIGIGNITAAEETVNDSALTALNQIQTKLQAGGSLTEKEAYKVMSQIRNEFKKMEKSGIDQEKISKLGNQACNIIRLMTNNAGELKKLNLAVSLMAKECIKGNDPNKIGEMLQEQLKNGQKLDKTIKQVQAQIRVQEQNHNETNKTGSSSGSGGSNGSGGTGENSGNGGKK